MARAVARPLPVGRPRRAGACSPTLLMRSLSCIASGGEDRIVIVDHTVECGTDEATEFSHDLYSTGLPVGQRTVGDQHSSTWTGATLCL